MVAKQRSSSNNRPDLELGIYLEIYSDLVFAGVGNQIDRWSINDMSIFWLKLQNKQALDRYIANVPTDKQGKPLKFKYPF